MLKSFWKSENIINKKFTLNIILIAHVNEPRGYINNQQIQCSDTERFSIEEFNEIYRGIVDAGYYIQAVYYNELDFLSDYIEHQMSFSNCIVYTLARNGIGNNKKILIPAFCELVGLKYTSSSSLSCAMCRNKYYFSSLLQAHKIPTPKSWLFRNNDWKYGMPPEGMPVIYKPCSESASQGVEDTSIRNFTNKESQKYLKTDYIVQEYIDGFECEVPIICVGGVVTALSPVGIELYNNRILGESSSSHDYYDFYPLESKCPPETIYMIQSFAIKTFELLQMNIYGRIDFRVTKEGVPFVFDISTTPYTTKHSSFAFAFSQLGFEYSDIYQAIITASYLR